VDRLALSVEEWMHTAGGHLRCQPLEGGSRRGGRPFERELSRTVQPAKNQALAENRVIPVDVIGQAPALGYGAGEADVPDIQVEVPTDGAIHRVPGTEMKSGLVEVGAEAEGYVADSALP
jgi:hypothetical protein